MKQTIKLVSGVAVMLVSVGLAGCQPAPTPTPESAAQVPTQSQLPDSVASPVTAGNPVSAITSTQAKYLPYTPEALEAALVTDNKVVLFFHAAWCPTCKAAEADIVQNASQLPADLTILKVDYDKEAELKKKYVITYQHTFVQIDDQGNEITKWNGGEVEEIKKRVR